MEDKAFMFDDFDTVVAKSLSEARTWYVNEYLDDPSADPEITERDLDQNTRWLPLNGYFSAEDLNNRVKQGDLVFRKVQGDLCIKVTLRDAIQFQSKIVESPYLLCSEEI